MCALYMRKKNGKYFHLCLQLIWKIKKKTMQISIYIVRVFYATILRSSMRNSYLKISIQAELRF